jgi:predicted membrane-bound spermidine synthase
MIQLTALLLTVATGFTGLVYEVAWQRYLAMLVGSHGEATAAVLAIFLGGLSAGYALFGWATRRLLARARARGRPPRLLYAYALVESGIGLYALAFPWLFGAAQQLSLLAPVDAGSLRFGFDVLLSALLIGPPTVLMGGTIPILTLALAGDVERATRVHAQVYGCNTLGAFAGALTGGFVLVPLLGLDGVVQAMGAVNLVAAAVFTQLDRGAPDVAAGAAPDPARPASLPGFAAVALLAGFAMMALQTTLNRVGALALGSSNFTFAMVVAVFVLAIALGSLTVSSLSRIPRLAAAGGAWVLFLLLFPLYVVLGDATYWSHVVRAVFNDAEPAFYAFHAAIFAALLAVLLLPIGMSGALLPLLFHELRREARDLGAVAGRLYAWNTVGSLLGALLGGYLLLVWLDLHHVFRIAMAAIAAAAALLTLMLGRLPRAVPVLMLVSALASAWLLPGWSPDRLSTGAFRLREPQTASFLGPDRFFAQRGRGEVVFYDDDPTSSVAVLEPKGQPERRSIVVNGKPDGNLEGDYPTMALSALLPALMADRHESAFVIGWGTGVTTGELAALEGTRSVRVAEISRGVIGAAPLFDVGNLAASQSPKVEVRLGDAYRTLLQSPERYDLIVSEPSNPWVSGVENLYSREFLEAARARLSEGGVFAQWFHLYESDVSIASLVLRTYAQVFPRVSVWFALGSDLLLLGFDREDRALDVQALEERFGRADFVAGFGRVGITSFPQLLAHELLPLGTLHAVPLEGEIHTLRHPILSYLAARAFFRGRHASLPPLVTPAHERASQQSSLLQRYVRAGRASLQDVLEAGVRETCRFNRAEECATLAARWSREAPGSLRLDETLDALRERGDTAVPPRRRIARLSVLFGGPLPAAPGGRWLARARRLTETFASNYHHAVPFDRRVIAAAWSQCQGERCDEHRRALEERYGILDGGGRKQP